MSLSQKRGGPGMRDPRHYYTASKMFVMSIPEERIISLFNFRPDTVDTTINTELPRQSPSVISNHNAQSSIYEMARKAMQDEKKIHIDTLNKFIAPRSPYIHSPDTMVTHRSLLKLINDKIEPRINSLRITGASSFLNIPAKTHYGIQCSNL